MTDCTYSHHEIPHCVVCSPDPCDCGCPVQEIRYVTNSGRGRVSLVKETKMAHRTKISHLFWLDTADAVNVAQSILEAARNA